ISGVVHSSTYLRSRCFVVSADAQTSRVEGVSDDNIHPVIADAWFVGEWVRFRVTKVRVLPLPLLHTIQIRDKHERPIPDSVQPEQFIPNTGDTIRGHRTTGRHRELVGRSSRSVYTNRNHFPVERDAFHGPIVGAVESQSPQNIPHPGI